MLKATTKEGRPALRGELDFLTAPELKTWLDQLDGQPTEIDLSGVTFFESITLRIFLVARQRNPQLRIVNPSKFVVKVLEITCTFDYLVGEREIAS